MSQSLFLTIHIASVLGSAQGSQWSLALEGFFASGNFKANDPLFPQGLTPPLESGGRQYPTCCLAPGSLKTSLTNEPQQFQQPMKAV